MVRQETERFPERVGEVPARLVPILWGLGHSLGQNLIGGIRQIRSP